MLYDDCFIINIAPYFPYLTLHSHYISFSIIHFARYPDQGPFDEFLNHGIWALLFAAFCFQDPWGPTG